MAEKRGLAFVPPARPLRAIAQPEDELTAGAVAPRLLSCQRAAVYLGVSADVVRRLIAAGEVSIIRLPAGLARGGRVTDENRRVLIDRLELDRLIDANRNNLGTR